MQYTFINDYQSYVYIAIQSVNCLQVLCLRDFNGSLLFIQIAPKHSQDVINNYIAQLRGWYVIVSE